MIDKTSYKSLFNCRFLSDGCRHLSQVQFSMPTSQCQEHSGHCILEEISHSSKYIFAELIEFRSFFKSSTYESRFGCVSNWWINFLTTSLRSQSSFWTVECGGPWILTSMLLLRVSSNFALRVSSYPSLRLL